MANHLLDDVRRLVVGVDCFHTIRFGCGTAMEPSLRWQVGFKGKTRRSPRAQQTKPSIVQ